jgi:pimeloyl-ACP methyl ester carboxylesterase
MKRAMSLLLMLAVFGPLFLTTAFSPKAYGQTTDEMIIARSTEIDGVKLHYLTTGHGMPLILLHGYAETSLMWKPIIPVLAKRFTVIAPDLPGIGDSDIPADGLDMKSAAVRIHDLAKSLGVQKAEVVGHDIGLMVAYAYAAQFPTEVTKLVLMDAFLPGVEGWEAIYDSPNIWHFRFNGPTPEALVQGRERTYFAYFWNDFGSRQDTFHPGCRPRGVYSGLLTAWTHACGLGIFRVILASRQGFFSTLSDQAGHAGFDDRRRQVAGSSGWGNKPNWSQLMSRSSC